MENEVSNVNRLNPNLINEVVKTEKMRILVKKAIPLMIHWAKIGKTNNSYGDLIHHFGYSRYMGIGKVLGNIHNVFVELETVLGMDRNSLPTLNGLLKDPKTGLPSDGFDYVIEEYSLMSTESQKTFAEKCDKEAISFKNWDYILSVLGLKEEVSTEDENKIRSGGNFGNCGEGEAHRTLKNFIASHPEIVGATEQGNTEEILLSGDRLDVWFPISKIAVEVKPMSSPDDDILRGLYQCVKYKAVLDAMDSVHGKVTDAKVILIIEGHLSSNNLLVNETLNINIRENFKVTNK